MQRLHPKPQHRAVVGLQRSRQLAVAIEDAQRGLDLRAVEPLEQQKELRFDARHPQIIDHETDAYGALRPLFGRRQEPIRRRVGRLRQHAEVPAEVSSGIG